MSEDVDTPRYNIAPGQQVLSIVRDGDNYLLEEFTWGLVPSYSKNENNLIGCSATNNGYEKKFGCTHKRDVYLDKENNFLKGIDHIFKTKDGYPIRYAFRFHINPELSVVKTMSGNSALIQISKNKSLIFTVHDENLDIEKSIFLGEKKIIDSSCITISGNLVNKNKTFRWEIKKNI